MGTNVQVATNVSSVNTTTKFYIDLNHRIQKALSALKAAATTTHIVPDVMPVSVASHKTANNTMKQWIEIFSSEHLYVRTTDLIALDGGPLPGAAANVHGMSREQLLALCKVGTDDLTDEAVDLRRLQASRKFAGANAGQIGGAAGTARSGAGAGGAGAKSARSGTQAPGAPPSGRPKSSASSNQQGPKDDYDYFGTMQMLGNGILCRSASRALHSSARLSSFLF